MRYEEIPGIQGEYKLVLSKPNNKWEIPAWSLLKLLELMPYPILHNTIKDKWRCTTYYKNGIIIKTGDDVDSPFDAVFEMECYLLEIKELARMKDELLNNIKLGSYENI
jgi:hypothetical protein